MKWEDGLERIKKVARGFGTGFRISAPVGDWNRGARNVTTDVETVQLLLEYVARRRGQRALSPGGIDGRVSRVPGRSATVRAINAFQRTFMHEPDGLVEPDGQTLRLLRRETQGESTVAPPAARSVMKSSQPGDGLPPWLYGFSGLSFSVPMSLLPGRDEQQPRWISIAEEELGETEIRGKKHNARVLEYHATTTGRAKTDESPWCSSFVNWVLKKARYEGTNSAWSHSWKTWGDGIAKPALGCIAFIDWGKVDAAKSGKGHVGFVVGRTAKGRIVLLGGNQSDKVRYTAFKTSVVDSYRVPKGFRVDARSFDLPLMEVSKDGSDFSATR